MSFDLSYTTCLLFIGRDPKPSGSMAFGRRVCCQQHVASSALQCIKTQLCSVIYEQARHLIKRYCTHLLAIHLARDAQKPWPSQICRSRPQQGMAVHQLLSRAPPVAYCAGQPFRKRKGPPALPPAVMANMYEQADTPTQSLLSRTFQVCRNLWRQSLSNLVDNVETLLITGPDHKFRHSIMQELSCSKHDLPQSMLSDCACTFVCRSTWAVSIIAQMASLGWIFADELTAGHNA